MRQAAGQDELLVLPAGDARCVCRRLLDGTPQMLHLPACMSLALRSICKRRLEAAGFLWGRTVVQATGFPVTASGHRTVAQSCICCRTKANVPHPALATALSHPAHYCICQSPKLRLPSYSSLLPLLCPADHAVPCRLQC